MTLDARHACLQFQLVRNQRQEDGKSEASLSWLQTHHKDKNTKQKDLSSGLSGSAYLACARY
jgi:hypothetical protein